jgi:hypothetical protein
MLASVIHYFSRFAFCIPHFAFCILKSEISGFILHPSSFILTPAPLLPPMKSPTRSRSPATCSCCGRRDFLVTGFSAAAALMLTRALGRADAER